MATVTDALLDVDEVAEYLNVSRRWVYAAAADKLPTLQLGGKLLRWRRTDLDKWLDDQGRKN